MRTALFKNWTEEEFTGHWNGKPRTFEPGESIYMPEFLARHFAKYLTNRELLRVNSKGIPRYKGGEKMTSPKKPEDVPLFMELFNKAFQLDDDTEEDKKDDIDTLINVANKNRKAGKGNKGEENPEEEKKADKKPETKANKKNKAQDTNEPQIIDVPDDEDDEDSFGDEPEK